MSGSVKKFLVSHILKVIECKREKVINDFYFYMNHDAEKNECMLFFLGWTPDGTDDPAKFSDSCKCIFEVLEIVLNHLSTVPIKDEWKLYQPSFSFPYQGNGADSGWPNENKTYRTGTFHVSTDAYLDRKHFKYCQGQVASLEKQLLHARQELEKARNVVEKYKVEKIE